MRPPRPPPWTNRRLAPTGMPPRKLAPLLPPEAAAAAADKGGNARRVLRGRLLAEPNATLLTPPAAASDTMTGLARRGCSATRGAGAPKSGGA